MNKKSMSTGSLVAITLLVLLGGIVIHEAGHAGMAWVFGAGITEIGITPWLIVYPDLQLTAGGRLGYVEHEPLAEMTQSGAVLMAGALANALVAYVALFLLSITRGRGAVPFALFGASLVYGIDVIAYTVFPMVGLKHWVFIGGSDPETMQGAMDLGIGQSVFLVALVVHAVMLTIWWSRQFRAYRLYNKLL